MAPKPTELRILRPGNSDTRTGAGTSASVIPPASTTSTFDTRLPIQAGDAIGVDTPTLSALANGVTGANTLGWNPRLADGGPARTPSPNPVTRANAELLINADIEPDVDGDGFGDETQDQCPTDAATQGSCPLPPPSDLDPPETKISKPPPASSALSKVKIKFKSDETFSTFECRIDKKPYKPCTSPKSYKVKPGRHKIRVRAFDQAGNVDPTPAKAKFRIRDV